MHNTELRRLESLLTPPRNKCGTCGVENLPMRTLVMLTRRIDAALEALWTCRQRLPLLRDLYRPGSPERAAWRAWRLR